MKDYKDSDWFTMMGVICPSAHGNRPRRLGVHAISAMVVRAGLRPNTIDTPLAILDEMEASKAVKGYTCPDVRNEIFFRIDKANLPGMITSGRGMNECFDNARKRLETDKFPEVQGYKRFSSTGKSTMDVPFEPADKAYEDEVLRVLLEYKNTH